MPSAHYQRFVRSQKQFCHWVDTSKCIQTVHVLVVETECIQFLYKLFNVAYWNNVISANGREAYLVIVASITVFCTHNVFFIFVWRKKLFNCFLEKIVKFRGIIFNITPAIWLMSRFLNKWIWKTRYYYISCKPTKTRKNFHIWKCPVTKTKTDAGISNEFQLQNFSLNFIHKKNNFFQLPAFYLSLTHGLQHYCFLVQTNLSRLYGLWQMPRPIWTVFMVQNDSN